MSQVIAHGDKERKNHKYVARIKVKSKVGSNKSSWRYFYTLEEYREYMKTQHKTSDNKLTTPTNKEKETSKNKKSTNKKLSSLVSKGSSVVDKMLKKTNTALTKKVSKGEQAIDKILKSTEKKATNTKKISKEKLSKYISKGNAALDKMIDKTEKIVDKKTQSVKKVVKTFSKEDEKTISKGKQFAKKQIDKTEVGFAVVIPKSVVKKAVDFVADVFDKVNKSFSEIKTKNSDFKVKLPNGKYKQFDNKDEYEDYLERLEYQKNEPDFMKKVKDISHNDVFTKFEDMEKINETYDPTDASTSMNCGNCSAAYELRRRGYDVEAKANGDSDEYNGRGDRAYDYFEGAEIIGIYGDGSTIVHDETFTRKLWDGTYTNDDFSANKDLIDYMNTPQRYTAKTIEKGILANNPPGSRGMIDVEWSTGGGHSIVYEVDKKGKVTIRDSQTYDEYSLDELAPYVKKVRITRTDNLQLKEGILDAVVTNKDDKRRYYVDKRIARPVW